MKLLISTGPGLDPSHSGHLIVVDWPSGRVVDQIEYRHTVHEQTRKGLEGVFRHEGQLFVTTECELLTFGIGPLNLTSNRTYPFMNDAHHTVRLGNRLFLCNTGLDCIEELDVDGSFVQTHDLLGSFGRRCRYGVRALRESAKKSYERFRGWDKSYDHLCYSPPLKTIRKLCFPNHFRRNGTDLRFHLFRPHVVHPNHLFVVGDDIWVTLFGPGEVVSLRTGQILASELGSPHDGVIAGNTHFITDCATNRLILHRFNRQLGVLEPHPTIKAITSRTHEGFLRGVAATDRQLFLGLTARRRCPPEFKCARILELDRSSLSIIREWVIPDEFGKNVFTILDVSDVYT